MKKFNLSTWALEHPQFTLFLILFLVLAGAQSYLHLGRAEEPSFTMKVMIVRTLWAGATTREMEQQVTERIEKQLQDVPWLDHLRSYSKPGESTIFVMLRDSTPPLQVPNSWDRVRKKLDDIRPELPAGVAGPFANDEFGDVYVNIFALTGDGVGLRELRREADRIARELRRIDGVKKVDLFGVQHEKIHIDIAPARLAQYGLTPAVIAGALQQQNTLAPQGFIETDADRIHLRIDGAYDGVERVRETVLTAGGRRLRLGDIAEVTRGYADPPEPMMRVAGKDAIGIGVAMAHGNNVIDLGARLDGAVARIQAVTPRGIEFHVIANQPVDVEHSIGQFMRSLAEAVVIVLAVSFLSLGLRTGMVVAISIPIVLAATFLVMRAAGIDLHFISLGALIIALGLMVDDAIIAVEMMVVKIEQGWDKARAAAFAYTSTAMPMLIGTLVTAAAFMPVGLAPSAPGEYAFAIFAVVNIALLLSWFVAVLITPYIGYRLLDVKRLRTSVSGHATDIYDTPFYRRFRSLVHGCLHQRWKVIGATLAAFIGSVVLFRVAVEHQFFPNSAHCEVMVHLWLPEGASIKATGNAARKLEAILAADPAVQSYAGYIGSGSPRIQLGQNLQLQNNNFSEYVVMTQNIEARDAFRARLNARFADPEGGFGGIRARALIFSHGPPVDYPVEFRLSGEDLPTLRRYAEELAGAMRRNPHARNVHLDWSNLAKGLRLAVDQDKARALGVSRQDLAQTLQTVLNGVAITQMREGDQTIDLIWRGDVTRNSLDRLPEVMVPTAAGHAVPLAQLARLEAIVEEGIIWRRDRLPSITLQTDLAGDIQGPTATQQMLTDLRPIVARLPVGYHFEVAGTTEMAAQGEEPIFTVLPWVGLLITTLLMMQLQSFSRTALVLITAPLGIIGVAIALATFRMPFGFVATLGVIALAGMIMRNSVILVDQIDQDVAAGKHLWDAIVDSTVRRFRPIVLTAAAAILAMIPLVTDTLWGPMAVAIMGGLIVATILTCLFLPALYAAWYRVERKS